MPNKRVHYNARKYKGYRSKARYLYYKRLRKYKAYLKEYERVEKYLAKYGLKPRSSKGPYSYSELFNNIRQYREEYGRGDIKFIVRQQAYKYTRKQALTILEHSRAVENQALKDFSIPQIMIGQEFDIDAEWKALKQSLGLDSDIADLTKEQKKELRKLAEDFQMEWFGYAS